MAMRRDSDAAQSPIAGAATVARDEATAPARAASIVNAMTVDVEEYFQVSAFAAAVDRADWDRLPSRVERSVERLLALFAERGARCTFFTLGWIAERHPAMIRRIAETGHEIASHGYSHRRVTDLGPDEFRADIRRTKAILEDVGGFPVAGFRAASFSFDARTSWAHEILAEEGYGYSSSVYPIHHDHYGVPDAPRFPYWPSGERGVPEFPMTTVRLFDRNLPCAGGGYFRLLPYMLFRWALRRVNGADRQPAIFYLHPWEIDPEQPRQDALSARTHFRHYVNIERTEARLCRLLDEFAWDRMDRVMAPNLGTST